MENKTSYNFWSKKISLLAISLFFTVFGAAITIVSAFIAIDANRQMKTISEEISTKYIGEFAHANQMIELINNIEKAKTNITIVSDVAAYACLSNPKLYIEYEKK